MANKELLDAVNSVVDSFDSFKAQADKKQAELLDRIEILESVKDAPRKTAANDDNYYGRDQFEHKDVFVEWMRSPGNGAAKRRLEEAENEMAKKNVTIGTDASGGYALPALIADQVERRVTTLNPFRQLVRVQQVGSSDYAHLVSKNAAGSGWVGEGGSRSETDTSDLVERKPTFGTVYAYPKASEEALQDIFFDVGDWLVGEVGDAFAAQEATAIVSGNGTNKPTGFLNASPVTTADDASPDRTAGTLQYIPMNSTSPVMLHADDLFDLAGAFKDGYLMGDRVAWVMRNATMTVIRKLKDSNNAYLFEPSLQDGVPGRLLGYPVFTTDAMPQYTADAHPIAFGNWNRGYLLAERSDIRITVDDNISTPGQIKWYVRRRVGGIVLNDQAIKVLKYADA